jgi:hypothetical protein
MFGYGAAAALVVSFAALAVFWPEARLEPEVQDDPADAEGGIGAGPLALRVAGVALFLLVFAAAAFGDDRSAFNLAPVAIYVAFWVGMTLVCALVADVWNGGLNPFATLGLSLASSTPRPYRWNHWPAAAGLLAFVWVELVLPSRADPPVLAGLMVAYTAAVFAGAARWGRPFLRQGEPFAAWFGTLGAMAPLTWGGRQRFRRPLTGLARLAPTPGLVAMVLVALGSTGFDGLTRSTAWSRLVGSRSATGAIPLATAGLAASIGVVTLVYFGAMYVSGRITGRPTAELGAAFVHSLVPIALAYAVAHYFSLLVLEGQSAIALVSDPFGVGWNLFGTAHRAIDYTLVSPNAIAYVQVASIVTGHVAGVVLAHDRALARFPKPLATRSQYPLLAALVVFPVGGLGLLLGG